MVDWSNQRSSGRDIAVSLNSSKIEDLSLYPFLFSVGNLESNQLETWKSHVDEWKNRYFFNSNVFVSPSVLNE